MLSINLVAVLVAAAVAFILGFLFHGPISGKLWMRLAKIVPTGNEKLSDMFGEMFWNFVVNLVTAYGLAFLIAVALSSPFFVGAPMIHAGLIIAFVVWLTFLVTSSSIAVIWMKASFKLWLFEAVCSLIVMLSMGAILASWR